VKNVLLINPWIFDFTAYDFWLRPLGLLTVAAALRRAADVDLRLVDCLDRAHPALPRLAGAKPDGRGPYVKAEVPKPAVLKGVPRRYSRYGLPLDVFAAELDRVPTPDMVLLTCTMTYWHPGAALAVELVRRRFGSVPIVLGGIYATLVPGHARRHSGADVVVEGPGEEAIAALAREILGDAALRPAGPDGEGAGPLRPAFDLLRDRIALPVMTSRGCPLDCSFCAGPLLHRTFVQRAPGEAADEIGDLVARLGARHIVFYDDALLLNKAARIVPILEASVRRALPAAYHTPNGLHVREIDDGLARLFRRAGVRSIYLSQESIDPVLLRAACPKVEPGDLERAAACLERAGYARADLSAYLIAGLPGQSWESVLDSVRAVRALGLRPRMAYFSPIPGTRSWSELAASGRIDPGADPLIFNKAAWRYLGGKDGLELDRSLQALLNAP
jgi:radical SAM superfamily enzyme YgiQ (UPF0313 family)